MPTFTTLHIEKDATEPRIARLTLARPAKLNAISSVMPEEIAAAVKWAEADDEVHVIVVEGEGRAFCAGFDLQEYAEDSPADGSDHPNRQEKQPWDPMVDYAAMMASTQGIMSLWHSRKPTIAKVHGYAVAGGSDIALCCDLLVMADDAKIGYMPTRVWGCPTTALWTYRLGAIRAKQLMFTGDVIDGTKAAEWGLANIAVPFAELEDATMKLATRIAGVPRSQLMMHKMVVNQVWMAMGLQQTQMFANVFDGITRHGPDGMWFRRQAQVEGFKSAVEWRDSGRPIPEGDEARALIVELERKLAERDGDQVVPARSSSTSA